MNHNIDPELGRRHALITISLGDMMGIVLGRCKIDPACLPDDVKFVDVSGDWLKRGITIVIESATFDWVPHACEPPLYMLAKGGKPLEYLWLGNAHESQT